LIPSPTEEERMGLALPVAALGLGLVGLVIVILVVIFIITRVL
jgi:hypothetical protein